MKCPRGKVRESTPAEKSPEGDKKFSAEGSIKEEGKTGGSGPNKIIRVPFQRQKKNRNGESGMKSIHVWVGKKKKRKVLTFLHPIQTGRGRIRERVKGRTPGFGH